MMEEECSRCPGATDFSIAAIMARQDRPQPAKKHSRREDDASSGQYSQSVTSPIHISVYFIVTPNIAIYIE